MSTIGHLINTLHWTIKLAQAYNVWLRPCTSSTAMLRPLRRCQPSFTPGPQELWQPLSFSARLTGDCGAGRVRSQTTQATHFDRGLHSAHYTLHIAHCTLQAAHWKLHTAHCKLHTAHFKMHTTHGTLHCILHTAHWKLYTSYCTVNNTVQTALHTARCTLQTVHCILHTANFTLHTTHCTLNTALHTAHWKCTLHTGHCTLHTAQLVSWPGY